MNNVISESNIKFDQTPKLKKFVMKLYPQIDVNSLNPFPEHLKNILYAIFILVSIYLLIYN